MFMTKAAQFTPISTGFAVSEDTVALLSSVHFDSTSAPSLGDLTMRPTLIFALLASANVTISAPLAPIKGMLYPLVVAVLFYTAIG